MVGVMKIMVTSLKRFHAHTATLSAANPAAGQHQPAPPAEVWVRGGLLLGWGTECSSTCMGPLKKVAIIFITSTIVWPWVSNREGTQLHPSTENWINNLLSMAPPIRTKPSFSLSQSLPSGSCHKPLILLHQKADRMKTTITEHSPK